MVAEGLGVMVATWTLHNPIGVLICFVFLMVDVWLFGFFIGRGGRR